MTEKTETGKEAKAVGSDLRAELEAIRREDVPDRLLILARHLQEKLRRSRD